ncbi:integrase [Pectobacterium odoriferum]|uniref:site-specific integrase n=1 Tax=Pectobacterium TaxID=122277 RepID=UPI000D45445A|nr:site-specific integrase [Pectobacterium odoriferum]POE07192.1 integrase [Pectobacterium odoriferum]
MINKINYRENDFELVTANSKYNFSIADCVWVLDKNIKLNTTIILDKLHISHHCYFLNTLSFFATTKSTSYTKKMFWAFNDFLKSSGDGLITDLSVENYHKKALINKADYLESIRVFFKKWLYLEYPGVTEYQIEILYKGKTKKRRIGEMVNTMDLNRGPLIENDIINFNEGSMLLYENGSITLAELVMVLITSYTGRRPIQTSHLKLKDILSLFGDTSNEVALNYPRAKHSGVFRSEFKKLKITEDLNDLIIVLSKENIDIVENKLGRDITNDELSELPLFIDLNALNEIKNNEGLYKILKTDFLHVKAISILGKIKKIAHNIDSLEHAEVINARRFRYSLGTRAAQEGYGVSVIAELMDHRSTKFVACYVKNIPEHAEKIDEIMTKSILNYVKAFKGELVNADTGGIKIKNHKGKNSGNCSNCNDCNAPVPIPCYTCPYFKPWIEAPHNEVYDFLVKERKRIADITGDIKMVTALDRTMIAVSEVINKCNIIKRNDNECN